MDAAPNHVQHAGVVWWRGIADTLERWDRRARRWLETAPWPVALLVVVLVVLVAVLRTA